MAKNWRFHSHDESHVRQLSNQLNVSPLLAQVLVARGYENSETSQGFLDAKMMDLHDPDDLPGVVEAADRVLSAINDSRRITIYGDYDVDGVTSTSILWHCLKLVNANVDYYIPHRLEEGYGLNTDALKQLHEEDPNRLLITVDCGIASVEEAKFAKELGLELIVTDHHQMAETLPEAACLVHPQLPGSTYPFPHLCGAGVAFKLAWMICQKLGDGKKSSPRMREFLKSAVGLAAIGTIADVVPLIGENRVIVRYGLSGLAERSNLGLKALMKVAGIDKNSVLESEDIGFQIAPRINAAGRLGQARLAVELLTTENPERAIALADYLNQLNNNRKTVERKILKQAKELVSENEDWQDQPALVLAHEDWHAGVIGIVANKVAEYFEKPTILISLNRSDGTGQGSGRSYAGYNLHAGLTACADVLTKFGGHKAAVGLKVDETKIDSFRELFNQHVAENHEVSSDHSDLQIDAEVRLADISRRAVFELDRLGPFGQKNERPVFASTNVELAQPPSTMGEGGLHLSITVKQHNTTIRAIAFGKGEWAAEMEQANGPISICYAASINRFRGRESVQLQLIDWQADLPQPESASVTDTQSESSPS